jgi:CHAD domain-containing protein
LSSTAEEALSAIVLGCVEHLRGNEGCVLARAHEEGIHQMRVAVRRLRSCLALYEALIPSEQRDYLTQELKWLIGELGPARDWDVFVAEVLGPVVTQIPDEDRLSLLGQHVDQQRDGAYHRAQAAVGAQRYLGLVLLLASWAEGRGWHDGGEDRSPAMQATAASFAQDRLQSIYEQLLAAGEGFATFEPEERHKVRIHIKKLRYASEFFFTLYPRRRVTPYLAAMKSLQDDLGTSNDRDVAKKLLKRVLKASSGKERAPLAYSAGLVVGWHSHVSNGREHELRRAWHSFVGRVPYWQPLGGNGAAKAGGRDASPMPSDGQRSEAGVAGERAGPNAVPPQKSDAPPARRSGSSRARPSPSQA